HQHALVPLLDRAEERIERDHRLARPHVSLEESLHRYLAREVPVDVRDRLVLVRGQLERKRPAISPDQLARLPQRRGRLLLPLAGPARDPELEQEQLVERESPPAALRLLD